MLALRPGSRIGGYEIRSHLGSGGMGEVWRAHDPRLGREVAIKCLPSKATAGDEQRQRFEREARMLAALNHPNVAAIYGAVEEEGDLFLILELVEGPTLADRLEAGPLPVPEAIDVCVRVAAGLDAAHSAGIIHRDLKPSNIKLRPDGGVKVLDLGLARMVRAPESVPDNLSTLSAETVPGVLVGTLAYMSPEQARGLPLDRRSDIFAFGSVLYECLTGKHAFARATGSDTLAAILTADPDWGALPIDLPGRVSVLLRRCLRKDPHRRLHDIADARLELEEAQEEDAGATGAGRVATAPSRSLPPALFWILGALLAGALGGILWSNLRRSPLNLIAPTVQATLELPSDLSPGRSSLRSLALSPDGRTLVFVGRDDKGGRLYRRALDGTAEEAIPGTEGGYAPFFSPDGAWLAYFTSIHLLKVSTAGGTPIKICEVSPITQGGAWAPGGKIIFNPGYNSPLWVVSENGGEPQPFTHLGEGEHSHLYPQVLPGGWVLITVVRGRDFQDLDSSRIVAFNPRSGERHVLVDGMHARYGGAGWIVFARGDQVLAAPFDLEAVRVTGPPVKVRQTIAVPHFDVSRDGTLAYASGPPYGDTKSEILRLDRQGNASYLTSHGMYYSEPRRSPDGHRLAVTRCGNGACKIFVFDRDRQALSCVTPEPGRFFGAVWSPDGKKLAFTSFHLWNPRLTVKAADGSGPLEFLTESHADAELANSWSPDGKTIAYTVFYTAERSESRRRSSSDIWMASVDRSTPPRPWIETPNNESTARFSSDGRFLAYVSDESGAREVYVRPVTGEGRVQISSGGGSEPQWTRGDREILYRRGYRFLAVALGAGPEPAPGPPRLLFEGGYLLSQLRDVFVGEWDASPDGQELFVLKTTPPPEPSRELMVVTGWVSELERLRQSAAADRSGS